MEGGILSPAVLGVEMLPPGDVPTASQQDVEEYIYNFCHVLDVFLVHRDG